MEQETEITETHGEMWWKKREKWIKFDSSYFNQERVIKIPDVLFRSSVLVT